MPQIALFTFKNLKYTENNFNFSINSAIQDKICIVNQLQDILGIMIEKMYDDTKLK